MFVYGLYVPLQNACFHKDILTVGGSLVFQNHLEADELPKLLLTRSHAENSETKSSLLSKEVACSGSYAVISPVHIHIYMQRYWVFWIE